MESTTGDFGESYRAEMRASTLLLSEVVAANKDYLVRVGRRSGLNSTDIAALEAIMMSSSITPGDLAQQLGLSPAAITSVVDRLERAGRAQREQHPTDRRAVIVSATALAFAIAMAEVMPVAKAVDCVLDGFTADEQATIERYLRCVAQAQRAARVPE